jgi:asparagine synthase (glutamine-hydrolysing)
MCGIAGIIDQSGFDTGILMKMSDILRHRGPDDEGYYIAGNDLRKNCKGDNTISGLSSLNHIRENRNSKQFSIGFLHRRLSIIDLEESGHQPMHYQEGRYVITYNGEVYNYIEIRQELISKGHRFRSSSDTEVILASFAEWGYSCVERFVGMWAFAIYDSDKRILFLSRDRFGIKPLYYSSLNTGKFAFASEAKALFTLNYIQPKANLNVVLEYLAFGAPGFSDSNLFDQIKTLPPATNLTYDLLSDELKVWEYYSLKEKVSGNNLGVNIKNAIEDYRTFFEESISLHLRSDVSVGACLSGGLDSSSIASVVSQKLSTGIFNTFTASFPGLDIDETPYVKKLSEKYPRIRSFSCYPNVNDFWDFFDKITWHQDFPFNSTSIYAQWEVMHKANEEGIKVLLDGQGADEVLGGYYPFAGVYLLEVLKAFKFRLFYNEYFLLRQNFTRNINTALGRAAYHYLPSYVQHIVRDHQRAGIKLIDPDYYSSDIKVPQRGGKSFKDYSLNSIKFGLTELLRYEDRNSMAFSIESRVPFLDHRLVEFSLNLNSSLKIKGGWTKYILRKALEPVLPPEIAWRRDKLGFVTPQNAWKKEISGTLADYLNSADLPPVLNKKYLEKMTNDLLVNPSILSEYWKTISFIKWAHIFKVTF